MVVKGSRRDNQLVNTLRRINMSRFFYPDAAPPPVPSSPGIEEVPLPLECARFSAPTSEDSNGRMEFMLLTRDKVLAADPTGGSTIYDDGFRIVRSGPVFHKPPVDFPISVLVDGDSGGGGGLYVLDRKNCLQVFVHGSVPDVERPTLSSYEDWTCEALPPAHEGLPLGSHRAYTLAGGGDSIWVSDDGDGTYAYDIPRRAWAKRADWALPFSGLAEYVPEHKLWFGLSRDRKGNPMCACNLAAAAGRGSPPVLRNVWEHDVKPHKEWVPHYLNLVHLGSCRFCIVRIFGKPSSECQSEWGWDQPPRREEVFAVLTAVEVVRSGELGTRLRMVKHRSVRYSVGECYNVAPLMVF